MTEQETAAKLSFLKALNKIQGTLEPTKKDSTNPYFNSRYASLSAVNDTIMGPLTENGFTIMSGGDCIDGKPVLRTTLSHKDGHSESFYYPLIPDATNPQHVGASVSYARRYALCAMLNLSVEDDDAETVAAPARTATVAVKTPTNTSGIMNTAFVPSSVKQRQVTIKGEAKHAWDIVGTENTVFSTLDGISGKIAEHAMKEGKSVNVAYKQNGKFFNITRIALTKPEESQIEEAVPF